METAIYLLGGAAMVSLLFAIIIAGRKVNEDINIKIQSGDFNKNIHWHFKVMWPKMVGGFLKYFQ